MVNNKRFFPLTPKGVKNFGYHNWKKSKNLHFSFSNGIKKKDRECHLLYKKIFFNDETNLKDTAICNLELVAKCAIIKQWFQVFNILKKKRIKNIFFYSSNPIDKSNIEDLILKSYFNNSFLNNKDIKSKFKIKLNNLFSYLKVIFFKKKPLEIISLNHLITDNFNKNKYAYFYRNYRDNNLSIDKNNFKNIDYKINLFLDKFFGEDKKKINKKIRQSIIYNFSYTYSYLEKKNKFRFNHKFVPNNTTTSKIRAFCLKMLKQNKNVTNILNGNTYLTLNISKNTYHRNLTVGTNIICGSSYEKSLINNLFEKSKNEYFKRPKIEVNKNFYNKKFSVNILNERVLIVGFPMNLNFYEFAPSYHAMNLLKHELKIIEICKSENIKIDYKIHPDRINEVKSLYKFLKINIVYEKLEDILENYQYVICPSPISSTFTYISLSKAKIITFNHPEIKWSKYAFNLSKKRTEMINCSKKKSDELFFKKEDLIKSLKAIRTDKYKKNRYKIKII